MVNGDSVNELLDDEPLRRIDRRTLLRLGFFGSIVALGAGAIAALVRFLYQGDHGQVDYIEMPLASVPKPGEMADHLIMLPADAGAVEAKIYIVNLRPDEGLLSPDAHSPGGLIVFSRKCPEEGCSLPWDPSYEWQLLGANTTGAFKCPCRGGVFTKAGIKVFGPAARNMDTIEVERSGKKIRIYPNRLHKGTLPGSPPDPAMFVSSPT